MKATLYQQLVEAKAKGQKKFAVLIDPDKLRLNHLEETILLAEEAGVDYFFLGGSLIVNNMLDEVVNFIKDKSKIPVILFPGNSFQLTYKADGILFLSLISGRNADLLIGHHVLSAPYLKLSGLEILSTGYMLIDGGISTTVSYISNTMPIPRTKDDIAVSTALAGEMLGLKLVFMDAGSGAKQSISPSMVDAVSNAVDIPVIVGGGIKSQDEAKALLNAGADVIVIGNAIEKNPSFISEIAQLTRHSMSENGQ